MARLYADLGEDLQVFPVAALPPTARTDALHRLILEGLDGGAGLAVEELAWILGARVLAELSGARPAPPGRRADRDRVWEAMRRIEADPAEALSLDELARSTDLGPFHFLRLFRREFGETPHQYRVQARLRRAVIPHSTTSTWRNP